MTNTDQFHDTKFIYTWRKYQQRVLDDLQEHLGDGHLHVIAPPGSGKTALGLEVAVRLNKPTLILAPTLAIRNQWIQRFCELFLQSTTPPPWISRDIRNPEFLTIVTYQGLHAACNDLAEVQESIIDDDNGNDEDDSVRSTNPRLDDIVGKLQSKRIKTIVVDEAHHLKNEWWQTLTKVKEKLKPVIVGLTATPPYDVTPAEWHRYIELNGPVDAEISVPELVVEGDLCPHQDYVYFSLPTTEERTTIAGFRVKMENIFNELKSDAVMIEAIKNHPLWQRPTEHLEWIYNNVSYYSACLIFLHANGEEIPQTHLIVIGDKKLKVPALDFEWMEIMLDFYLFKEKVYFKKYADHQKGLEARLRRAGAMEKRQIRFTHNKNLTRLLSTSISKLNGIREIVEFEFREMANELRMVILCDFIRKEVFVDTAQNNVELNKIGVIPVFEKIRRECGPEIKLGVLTGSLVIIPLLALPLFKTLAAAYGISTIDHSPVPYDDKYVVISQSDQLRSEIVHVVTQVFQQGKIHVLIGTKSLLGEGWDAPAVNSLILATFVGSFVLSNQMRGRAIRTHKENQGKTGNIWHLACVDPTEPNGGDDFEILKRRFRSFVGVSFKEDGGIESGINRLNLPSGTIDSVGIQNINAQMFQHAGDRDNLRNRWRDALEKGVSLVEEIKIPFAGTADYQRTKSLFLNKTIANLIGTLGSGISYFLLDGLQIIARSARTMKSLEQLYSIIAGLGVVGVFIFGRLALKTLRLYIQYRDISKDIQQIGEALLNSLIKEGAIQTKASALRVDASVDRYGAVFCHLEGGTTFEKSTFINALQEIVGAVDNPRYIIVRKSQFLKVMKQTDYHPVPEVLGRNKNLAEYFKGQWERLVGGCHLIFTRSVEGRRLLLKARMKSLAAQFDDNVEHVSKWK